ncbi:MAG: hypothetical protein QNK05_16345 [Myxococcota bacterium]|nr:hypothetical protein [Myxococcota bacterium]
MSVTSQAGASLAVPSSAWGTHREREGLIWLFLALAASPVLLDTASHLLVRPWAAYCLVFWVLFVREVLRTPAGYAPRASGWLLVAVAMSIELLLVRADWARWARPAVALAMAGAAIGIGHPRGWKIGLAFWTVPMPTLAASLASPQLERLYLKAAELLATPLGHTFLVTQPKTGITRLEVAAGSMDFVAADGGLYVATLLAGLGFYTALREGLEPSAVLRRMATFVVWALPLQIVAVGIAVAVLIAGWPEAARLGLSVGPWLLATIGVFTVYHRVVR